MTTTADGDQVRCVSVYGAGFLWERDTGIAQQDPALVAASSQQKADSYVYCVQHSPAEECHQIVYGTP